MNAATDQLSATAEPLLEVEDLRVAFPVQGGAVQAVAGISFAVQPGQTLGIVGESGSGKSVTALTAMGLTRRQGARVAGRIRLGGRDLLELDDAQMRSLRGNELAMIFQDPLAALHPLYRVGWQLVEALRAHRAVSRSQARTRALELLELVGIPEPPRRIEAYPHELSGGMRQRVMIAMAIANEPKLLIADEPTSALDVTVQAQILALLRDLRQRLGMALVLITHDLGVVAELADEVAVMRAGTIVERGSTQQIFAAPREPYTRTLLRAIPRLDDPLPDQAPAAVAEACDDAAPGPPRPGLAAVEDNRQVPAPAAREPLLEVRDLVKHFAPRGVIARRRHGAVRAVDGAGFALAPGEALGLVGETGCGKSTTARLVMRLLDADAGEVHFAGEDVTRLRGSSLQTLRRGAQMVFQDPYSSLNPRRTIGSIVGEPLAIHGLQRGRAARGRRVGELLETVGLAATDAERYPHEFSGGQRQRIALARALAPGPRLLVADEPVSALDVSIQAQILQLLRRLQHELELALLFISHDLAVVRQMCDRVAIMQAGRIVELAPRGQLYDAPQHPYTRALLAAVPGAGRDRRTIGA